jgi:hypothetical protein
MKRRTGYTLAHIPFGNTIIPYQTNSFPMNSTDDLREVITAVLLAASARCLDDEEDFQAVLDSLVTTLSQTFRISRPVPTD